MAKKSTKISIGIIIIAVILFIILGLPAITGGIVKHQVDAWQRQVTFPDRQMTIKITHYHRGWFHSNADVKISTKQPLGVESQLLEGKKSNGVPKQIVLNTQLQIAHGPFAHLSHPITGHSWSWGAGMANVVIKIAQPRPSQYPDFPILKVPIIANMLLKWDGTLVIWIKQQPGVIYKDSDSGVQATIKGIHSKIVISRNFDQFSGRTQVNHLQVQFSDNGQVVVDKVTHDLDLQLHNNGIWYGKSVVTIPVVRFTMMSKEAARLDNVVLTSGNERAKDNTFTVRDRLSIGKISVVGQKIGAVDFDVSIEKLNPQAFLKFRGLYQKLQQQLAGIPTKQSLGDKEKQQMIGQIQPVITEFLKGVEFRLNTLQLKTGSGQAKLTGMLTLPKTQPVQPAKETGWKGLVALAQSANGEAKFTVSAGLLNQALGLAQFSPRISEILSEIASPQPETMAAQKSGKGGLFSVLQSMQQQGKMKTALVEKGWLQKEGDHYVIHVRYHKQDLTINGRPLEKLLPPLETIVPAQQNHSATMRPQVAQPYYGPSPYGYQNPSPMGQ
ncbi:MAG: YdgA family protein [Gammaproteobacteria bacterium]|nr:YdgA family protein [Gammaproteobacteria bacterium]